MTTRCSPVCKSHGWPRCKDPLEYQGRGVPFLGRGSSLPGRSNPSAQPGKHAPPTTSTGSVAIPRRLSRCKMSQPWGISGALATWIFAEKNREGAWSNENSSCFSSPNRGISGSCWLWRLPRARGSPIAKGPSSRAFSFVGNRKERNYSQRPHRVLSKNHPLHASSGECLLKHPSKKLDVGPVIILLMKEIRLTTQHAGNPANNEIFAISTRCRISSINSRSTIYGVPKGKHLLQIWWAQWPNLHTIPRGGWWENSEKNCIVPY